MGLGLVLNGKCRSQLRLRVLLQSGNNVDYSNGEAIANMLWIHYGNVIDMILYVRSRNIKM